MLKCVLLFVLVWQIHVKRLYAAEGQLSETGKWTGWHTSSPAAPLSPAATLPRRSAELQSGIKFSVIRSLHRHGYSGILRKTISLDVLMGKHRFCYATCNIDARGSRCQLTLDWLSPIFPVGRAWAARYGFSEFGTTLGGSSCFRRFFLFLSFLILIHK